ncbi:MAG: YciI family protein [Chitinophagales bacterium]
MKEFMLLIRNEGDSKSGFAPEMHQQFLKACEVYIEGLKKKSQLISAQPLIREGKMIAGNPGAFKEGPFSETKEVIVGYYHILAKDLEEAIEIAKGNPEFAYTKTARVEVRPVKMKEESTAYTYPKR